MVRAAVGLRPDPVNDIAEAAEATIFGIKPLPEIVGLLLEDIVPLTTFDDGIGATVRMPIPIEAGGGGWPALCLRDWR